MYGVEIEPRACGAADRAALADDVWAALYGGDDDDVDADVDNDSIADDEKPPPADVDKRPPPPDDPPRVFYIAHTRVGKLFAFDRGDSTDDKKDGDALPLIPSRLRPPDAGESEFLAAFAESDVACEVRGS